MTREDFIRNAGYFTWLVGVGLVVAIPSPILAIRLWDSTFARIFGVIGGIFTIACLFSVWRLVPAYVSADPGSRSLELYTAFALLCILPAIIFSIAALIASLSSSDALRLYWVPSSLMWLMCIGAPLAVGIIMLLAFGAG